LSVAMVWDNMITLLMTSFISQTEMILTQLLNLTNFLLNYSTTLAIKVTNNLKAAHLYINS
jgi:hypothetical protein